jgi:type IV pilus assembly protein PilM
MTALLSPLAPTSKLCQPWLKCRRGWIGIDIGTAATKLAQLERVGNRIQLVGSWIIEDYGGQPLTRESLASAGMLPFQSQLSEARAMFRGRRAAATLPLAMTDVRVLELPAGSDDELRNMMHEELLTEMNERADLCFDYLPTQPADSAEGDMGTYSVFATPASIAACSAHSLRAAGVECEVLDSLPCALARAAHLCEPEASQTPLAALDFGYSSAMLVVARGGQLLFTRQLRNCGLSMLLKPLQDGLRLSAAEARQLLAHHSNTAASNSSPLAAIAKSAQGMIAEPLAQVVAEVKRTLDFIDLQFRSIVPKKLIVLGGGAVVPALPAAIAEETGVPTRLWALPSSGDQPARADEALFGVAAALSSLAWETPPCT